MAQLKQLFWAQYAFTIENNLSATAYATLSDLRPFVPLTPVGTLIPCPEGGTYSASATVLDPIACTFQSHGHVVNAP